MGGCEFDGGAHAALGHVFHEGGLKIAGAELRFGEGHEVVNRKGDEGDNGDADKEHRRAAVDHPLVEKRFLGNGLLGEKLWSREQGGNDCSGRCEAAAGGEVLSHEFVEGCPGSCR